MVREAFLNVLYLELEGRHYICRWNMERFS